MGRIQTASFSHHQITPSLCLPRRWFWLLARSQELGAAFYPPGGKTFVANKALIEFDRTVTEPSNPFFCLVSPSNHVVSFAFAKWAICNCFFARYQTEHMANQPSEDI
jgi:hypothetical protein